MLEYQKFQYVLRGIIDMYKCIIVPGIKDKKMYKSSASFIDDILEGVIYASNEMPTDYKEYGYVNKLIVNLRVLNTNLIKHDESSIPISMNILEHIINHLEPIASPKEEK